MSKLTAEQLEYRAIRARSHCENEKEFDKLVRKLLDERRIADPEPADWIAAARQLLIRCSRCAGTGRFITASVNGKPTGPGGDCYRCGVKERRTMRMPVATTVTT